MNSLSVTGNNVGTKDGERREKFSCLVNEADQKAKFSSISGYCHKQKQQGLTNTVVKQGVYLSRRICLLRSPERLNETMERKMRS